VEGREEEEKFKKIKREMWMFPTHSSMPFTLSLCFGG
jgi:hypothetical protein